MTPLKPREPSASSAALASHSTSRFCRPCTLCPRSGFASTSPTSRPRHARTGGRGPGSPSVMDRVHGRDEVRSEGEGGVVDV